VVCQGRGLGILLKTVGRIEMPKTEQPDVVIFTLQEISRLITACEQTRNPLRNKAILHILLDTGVRASELCYDGDRPQEETGLRLDNTVMGKAAESYIWVMGQSRKGCTVGIGNQSLCTAYIFAHFWHNIKYFYAFAEIGYSKCFYSILYYIRKYHRNSIYQCYISSLRAFDEFLRAM
jgi:hypothetical protein